MRPEIDLVLKMLLQESRAFFPANRNGFEYPSIHTQKLLKLLGMGKVLPGLNEILT